MAKPATQPNLIVEIDASIAARYRAAYALAFGSGDTLQQPLENFIASFVEDRLAEELAFVDDESPRRRK